MDLIASLKSITLENTQSRRNMSTVNNRRITILV